MIPKIAHFYWGAPTLPFLRYMTLHSFRKFNPDWEIRLHVPDNVSTHIAWDSHEQEYSLEKNNWKDYWDDAKKLNIQIINSNRLFGIDESLPEVAKSDRLRWYLLHKDGGLWSDMDILYFKPIPEHLLYYDAVLSYQNEYYSIGFLMSTINSQMFQLVAKEAKKIKRQSNYQTYGSLLLKRLFPYARGIDKRFNIRTYNIPPDLVYPYKWNEVERIFSDEPCRVTDTTIGIHWFAGHAEAGRQQSLYETNSNQVNGFWMLCNQIKEGVI